MSMKPAGGANYQPVRDFVSKLGNGWNLGNTLDAVASKPSATVAASETAWGNPVTTKEMIDTVAMAGFEVLRVPVTWDGHFGPGPDYTIDEKWLERVAEVVDYGLDNKMTVILNLHHEEWHFPSEENYEKASGILKKLWAQIAKRFENYGENLIFEAMNEPRMKGTAFEWNGGNPEGRDIVNRLNADFVNVIRQSGGNNPARHLMLPTYAASSDEKAMAAFKMPKDDNIIVSIHSYTPYLFALSEEDVREWSAANPNDTRDLINLFRLLDKYFLSKGFPVILGEMGSRNRSENTQARTALAEYYANLAKTHSVPLVWWDNGIVKGNGELFGLLDRRQLEWFYPTIVEAMTK